MGSAKRRFQTRDGLSLAHSDLEPGYNRDLEPGFGSRGAPPSSLSSSDLTGGLGSRDHVFPSVTVLAVDAVKLHDLARLPLPAAGMLLPVDAVKPALGEAARPLLSLLRARLTSCREERAPCSSDAMVPKRPRHCGVRRERAGSPASTGPPTAATLSFWTASMAIYAPCSGAIAFPGSGSMSHGFTHEYRL